MVTPQPDGRTTFRLYHPGATHIEIRGGFTGWDRPGIPMRPDGNGWWHAHSNLPPGDHLFSYLVDHHTWLPDYAAHGIKPNGFGGWVSQLHIASHTPAARAA